MQCNQVTNHGKTLKAQEENVVEKTSEKADSFCSTVLNTHPINTISVYLHMGKNRNRAEQGMVLLMTLSYQKTENQPTNSPHSIHTAMCFLFCVFNFQSLFFLFMFFTFYCIFLSLFAILISFPFKCCELALRLLNLIRHSSEAL